MEVIQCNEINQVINELTIAFQDCNKIKNIGNHYLYRHIRLDINQPFYIGIGTATVKQQSSKTSKTRYRRAYDSTNRNKYWKNIVNKFEYEVEILLESDDYEFIKQKEIEFIALYGRKDLTKGVLCNRTDGGDNSFTQGQSGNLSFNFGRKLTEERRKALSEQAKEGLNPASIKVINTLTLEEFSCIKLAALSAEISYGVLAKMLRGGITNKTNFVYLKDYNNIIK